MLNILPSPKLEQADNAKSQSNLGAYYNQNGKTYKTASRITQIG
jgi:hypothetical protein